MKSTKNNFISGVRHSIPIWIGYIPSAITLGILCNTNSLGLLHAFLSSFVLYSGAAQFMLVGFLTSSVPLFGIAVSVFLLNTRLFLMSVIHDKLMPLGLSRSESSISYNAVIDRTLPIEGMKVAQRRTGTCRPRPDHRRQWPWRSIPMRNLHSAA